MQKYKNHSLKRYLDALADKSPVPGGGSAAALTAALGVALIAMVARYSTGKSRAAGTEKKIRRIVRESDRIRSRLLRLVDLDAEAYMKVVKARRLPQRSRIKALRQAQQVPQEVCLLCFQAVDMTSFLAGKGNKNLLSDIEVALDLLTAAFRSARITAAINAETN